MPGPPPKPTRLKLLEGNPGKQKLNGAEPKPSRGLPECPPRLKGAARDAWDFLTGQLVEMGLDYQSDGLALEGGCRAYGRAVEADEAIDAGGSTFQAGNGYTQQRPEVSIAERNWKLFRGFCTEFGFTPAARCRLSVQPKETRANKFAKLGGNSQ